VKTLQIQIYQAIAPSIKYHLHSQLNYNLILRPYRSKSLQCVLIMDFLYLLYTLVCMKERLTWAVCLDNSPNLCFLDSMKDFIDSMYLEADMIFKVILHRESAIYDSTKGSRSLDRWCHQRKIHRQ